MKKSFISICAMLLAGMLAVSLTSCVTSIEEENTQQTISKLVFKGKVSYGGIDTKVVKTGWTNGDKVYAFFSGVDAEKYVTLTYTGSDPLWEATPSTALTDIADLGTSGTMSVVYFPFGSIDIASDGASGVTFTSGGQPVYTYYLCGSDDYSITTSGEYAILSSDLTMTIPEGYVHFFVDAVGDDYKADNTYFITADGFQPVACTGFDGSAFTEVAGTVGDPVWGYAYRTDGISFSGKIDNTWDGSTNHDIILYTGAQPYPLKYMKITASLASHQAVKLANWTDCGFHGYEIAVAVLNGGALGKHDSFGVTFPSTTECSTVYDGSPLVPIKVFESDNSVTELTASHTWITGGLLLIRDGARLQKSDLTSGNITVLESQGCLLIPDGKYWTSSTAGNGGKYHYLTVDSSTSVYNTDESSANKNSTGSGITIELTSI